MFGEDVNVDDAEVEGFWEVRKMGDYLRHRYPLLAVATMVEARLKKGEQKYGESAYLHKDILAELQEELLDVMAYAYLQWLKVQALRERGGDIEYWFKVGGTDCGD